MQENIILCQAKIAVALNYHFVSQVGPHRMRRLSHGINRRKYNQLQSCKKTDDFRLVLSIQVCPRLSETTGVDYYLTGDHFVTWWHAKDICEGFGANLIKIDDEAEDQAIQDMLGKFCHEENKANKHLYGTPI